MTDRLAWPYSIEQESIFRWRAQLLFVILFMGLVLGSFAFIAAVTLIIKEGAWGLAIVDTIGLFIGIILLAVPRVRFEIRASIACLTCYIIGMAVIISVGPLSGGPIWLFAFAVLAGALLGNWAAFVAILINTISLIVLGVLMSTGKFGNSFPFFSTPQAMVTAGASFFLLNTLTSISVSALLKGLNESEKRYRLIAENVADVIWTMDMDFNFTYISPSIYQLRGFTVKEALNQSIDEIFLPNSVEKSMSLFAEKLSLIELGSPDGWKPVVFETEQYCKDGTIIWTSTNARILPGSDGKPKSTLGITVDITNRKKSEKKLRQSEEKFRTAFKTSPHVITLTSIEDGCYIDINDTFTKLLGYTPDEIIGESSLKFNIWNEPKDRDLLVAGLKKNGIVENLEADFKGKNGQIINGIMSARILDTENKKYLLAVTQDVTELKKNEKKRIDLENRLQQAQKMESIGTLTGGIAHDFNNLLYMIVGNTELALENIPKWNQAYTNLEEIKSASHRAAGIVKQLLTFSRKTDQKLIPIEAVKVIKDSLNFLRSTIPTTIEIIENMPDDDIVILSDSTQINQIMMNLCINASQAMEETGGILKINIEKTIFEAEDGKEFSDLVPGEYLKITINDTGPGISPEIINQIFDPYFTTKDIGKGSGMGLSIVHGIIKNHGGSVSVDSQPGKGTTFTLLFPVAEKKSIVKTEMNDEHPFGTETILFVDDEQAITDMTQKILEKLGYRVEARLNPAEALNLFQLNSDTFDLVITDMTMPQMTGVKLAQRLKEIQPDIPVIICTGHSSLIDEEKAKQIGIAGYVMKPASMSTIAKAIRRVLDK